MSDWWYQQTKRSKSQSDDREFEINVVGVTFDNRQQIIRRMVVGEPLLLRREPHNPHDKNAIRVERQNGEHVGYAARGLAAALAPAFDDFGNPIPARVTEIVGGYRIGSSLGLRIRFTCPNQPAGNTSATSIDGFTASDF